MNRKFIVFLSGLLAIVIISIACKKEKQSTEIIKEKKEQSYLWNSNDDRYVAALKQFANKRRSATILCTDIGNDSTYGWYSDPDSLIHEGPYIRAKVGPFENMAQNCTELFSLADSAEAYLINEGYEDLVPYYATKPHWMVQAGNVLLDLKTQMLALQPEEYRQAKLVNCILQAIGYSAIAEIGTNWATMSRQRIIAAVGKLAARHLNFFGAVVAMASFIDCMWG